MTIKDADWGYRILRKMPSNEQATLVEKIILYLGEYIDESTVEELQMAWKSIGQRMGFVSAGDARRAAEKAGVEKGFDKALDVMRKLGIPEEKIQEAKAMQEKASNK